MEKLNSESFLDQHKPFAHIIVAIISFITISWLFLKNQNENSIYSITGVYILIFLQIETFILTGRLIFRELKPGIDRTEFTRIVLLRLLLFMIICFSIALVIFLIYKGIVTLIGGGDIYKVPDKFIKYEFASWSKSTISGLAIGGVIFLVLQWQDALKREQKLREENLIFQNETLKNQVNPHFLFNNLNTLSELIATNTGTADRFLAKLASIYRYILENGTKEKVPLEHELSFINNYFFLQKIRDKDKVILNISVSEAEKYMILPVSLQILVENAIKHNMATHEKPLIISVYSESDCIVVENNLQKKEIPEKTTKIGLKNLSERIRISTGKNLVIDQSPDKFKVKIPLFA